MIDDRGCTAVRLYNTTPPPRHHLERATLPPLRLQVILAEEEDAPAGSRPLRWLLVTSLPIASLEDALCTIRRYSYRWLIERYHFILKRGCRLEHLQLENVGRRQRALATYLIVAWRLLWLTYAARRQPDQPCSVVFETHEWQALYGTLHRTAKPPETPPTLRPAVHWMARLGGFIERRADGEPGVQTIWLGEMASVTVRLPGCSRTRIPTPRLLALLMGNAEPRRGGGRGWGLYP
jgi:hypothetical protein